MLVGFLVHSPTHRDPNGNPAPWCIKNWRNGQVEAEFKTRGEAQKALSKMGSFQKRSYVEHCPGHKNSQGESAEWCVKSHETDKVLSSHKSEAAAKKHLQDMHAHSGSALLKRGDEAPPKPYQKFVIAAEGYESR